MTVQPLRQVRTFMKRPPWQASSLLPSSARDEAREAALVELLRERLVARRGFVLRITTRESAAVPVVDELPVAAVEELLLVDTARG